MIIIESPQNKIFKEAMLLKDKKYRNENGLFLVEGQKQTGEINKSWNIKKIFISQSFSEKFQPGQNCPPTILSDHLFNKLSATKTPQGIIAVVEKKQYNAENLIKNMKDGFFVILDMIQDPGNLGTIIRSADAFGCKGVFVSKNSADIYSDKVMRSTMGSVFHIPVIDEADTETTINSIKSEGFTIFAASLDTKTLIKNTKFPSKSALIIGNESKGLPIETQNQADKLIKINMPGNAESLNAAVAAAIFMYEISGK